MNIKLSRNNFIVGAGLAAVLFTSIFPMPALRAQPAERAVPGRYLFIFDTSWTMKKRLPAVEKTLTSMLATSMGGQLHTGDTIGVWTFNQDLYPGDVPLQVWDPDAAATIAGNISKFVGSRKYENSTRFEALQPLLNRVVQNSQRLTVVIFCDGATKITGTTFDNGVNQLFATNGAAQKKARQPFVVLLRSQLGKFVGCTVSCPPQLVSFPQFPPLPAPVVPKPAPVAAPVTVPAVVPPPLIITGTKIAASPTAVTNPPPANPPPTIQPAPATNPSAPAVVAPVPPPVSSPVVPVAPTNAPVVSQVNPPAPTNAPVVIPAANPIVPTNAPAAVLPATPVEPANVHAPVVTNVPVMAAVANPVAGGKKLVVIGALSFVVVVVVTAMVTAYFRRPDRHSLISRAMDDK
jgi:hypothetical protein